VVFKKVTKQQRERLKLRRAESRKRFLARLVDETFQACYYYVGEADGELCGTELEFLSELFPGADSFSSPTKEALARKVRAYLSAAAPTLAERRRLRNGLARFAVCDGALTGDEQEALRGIEELLGLSVEKRASARRAWGASRVRRDGEAKKKAKSQSRTRAHVNVSKPAPPPWCYEYLGCAESDSDEVIKRCYRQLAVKLHPDKHASRAKTPEEVALHVQAFQKLQAAYAEVWSLREKAPVKR
jgi:DnaJ-domain-containing protein 1